MDIEIKRKREIKWKTIKKLWENYMRNIES